MKNYNNKFLWGTATSSFQIEGGSESDGKLPSIWDTFCKTNGKIKNGDIADISCDHYNRWEEDIKLLEELGVNSYRFSISWPRIYSNPNLNIVNNKGLDFYDKLIDKLLEKGIIPFITLNHWDIPQSFQDKGGWLKRDNIEYFLNYVNIITSRLGDKVKHWITHNEPWVISNLGYFDGIHAPGNKSRLESFTVAHHLMVSHGLAIPIIRENSINSEVGISLNLCPAYPASSSEHDRYASLLFDQSFNKLFLNPLHGNNYPNEIISHWKKNKELPNNLNFIKSNDINIISTPTDFLGINYYSRSIVRSNLVKENENLPIEVFPNHKTEFDWEVYPDGLEKLLISLNKNYKLDKIYITENGASYTSFPDKNGNINDINRIKYLDSHIIACNNAIIAGVPLKGYFLWSLMDNFEWAEGYRHRFGLIHIDFNTLERKPKSSFYWYKNKIEYQKNILPLTMVS